MDLTHELSGDSVFWPTGETFRLEKVADGVTEKGYYYASNRFAGNEHGGTHIDAPVHFAQGRWTVDQIPLDSLIGNAIVVDVSAASSSNADYQVSVADFTAWEQAHRAIEPGTIVLIRTDFSKAGRMLRPRSVQQPDDGSQPRSRQTAGISRFEAHH